MDALKSAGRAIIRSPSKAKQSWSAGRHRSKQQVWDLKKTLLIIIIFFFKLFIQALSELLLNAMLFLLSFFFNEKKEEGTAQKATATEFQRQSIPRQLRGLFFCEFLLLFVCLFIGVLQWLRSLTSFYLTQSFKQRDNILLPLLLEPHISAWCHFRTKTCNLLHVFCATLLWDIWKTQRSPCVFEEFPGNKVYFEGEGRKNNTGINVVWRWNQILTFFSFFFFFTYFQMYTVYFLAHALHSFSL